MIEKTIKCRQCKKTVNKETAIQLSQKIYVCSEECAKIYYDNHNKKSTQPKKDSKEETLVCKCCKTDFTKQDGYYWAHKSYFCSQKCAKEYLGEDEFYEGLMLDIVWDLCGKQGNFSALKKQAERYHDVNEWRYSGMYYTVKYYVEILEGEWNQEWGLGQIFNLTSYNEAKDFYSKKHNIIKQFSSPDLILDEEPTIHIQKAKVQNRPEKYIDLFE